MKITEHFDSSEFTCPCGCGSNKVSTELVNKLEELFKALNAKYIFVSSGYRCPTYSPTVGGYSNDAHTRGIAADICAMKQDGNYYSSETIAREAEKLGFTGIGIIDNTFCHVDIRSLNNYVNNHWFGDERTGNDWILTFSEMGEPIYYAENINPVSYIQAKLNANGYSCGSVDGICGDNTIAAMYKLIKNLWG